MGLDDKKYNQVSSTCSETILNNYINNNNDISLSSSTSSDIKLNNNDNNINNNNENVENGFPASIKYIMFSEIGERYSYYSFRAILINYLISYMGYSSKLSSAIGHSLSSVYSIGSIIFAITSIPNITGSTPGNRSPFGIIIGLSFIAIGNGGIKPVVSAFCGDQFVGPNQKKLLSNLFQLFYWCANFGSFFSSFLSPILRSNVGYWCAFSLPAFILSVSVIVFIMGNQHYIKRKPESNILSTFLGVVRLSIIESIKSKFNKKNIDIYHGCDSWVDRAQIKYDSKTILEVKLVLRIFLVFLPLPMFWSLFDQIGTRWVIQANSMNRKLNSITIDSEIIGAINPLLVMLFVPFFEFLIFRPLKSRNINFTPLKKIGVGMLLAAISFFIAGLVQISIDRHNENSIHIAYQIPQYIVLTGAEVLIFITGLEFAYSNSPKSMKSIIMAGWLTTIAIGSLFDAFVIALIQLDEYILDFFFGSIMLIFLMIFIILAYNFKPIDVDYLESLNFSNSSNNSDNNSNSDVTNNNVNEMDTLNQKY